MPPEKQLAAPQVLRAKSERLASLQVAQELHQTFTCKKW
jgi:hypothetical protein